MWHTLVVTALAAVALTDRAVSAGIVYQVTDLGDLGGSPTIGRAINSSGQVTGDGWTSNSGGADHAFLYSAGVLRDIGGVRGFGINGSGQVTGLAAQHAFLYTNGVRKDLGTLGGSTSEGTAINDSGQVAGYSDLPNNTQHAFLYSGGSMHDLGTLGGTDSSAFGVNASGQVTGRAITTGNTAYHAFLYSGGVMSDLSAPGDTFSVGFAINASAQVTGYNTLGDGAQHAFLYSGGVMKDLGTLGGSTSAGLAINDIGQVVGDAFVPNDPHSHAFLYSGGAMVDLNSLISPTSGWFLEQAMGINSGGQITGYGLMAGKGGDRAFLLTPVPEPSSIILLALAGLGLFARFSTMFTPQRSRIQAKAS
jgi:probable HAF family extracellular repeat protein